MNCTLDRRSGFSREIAVKALRLKRVLESAEAYPFCHRYAYWPGPNSNTFAAWVLRKAGIRHALARRAIGRGYPC